MHFRRESAFLTRCNLMRRLELEETAPLTCGEREDELPLEPFRRALGTPNADAARQLEPQKSPTFDRFTANGFRARYGSSDPSSIA